MNASVVLVIFVLLLTIVEVFGIYAGILFVSGQMAWGLALYIAKIPVAGFTFWLFRVTEDKLMEFAWFKKLYLWILRGIAWLKATEVYISTLRNIGEVKERIKSFYRAFKAKYFAEESAFMRRVKALYQAFKNALKKQ